VCGIWTCVQDLDSLRRIEGYSRVLRGCVDGKEGVSMGKRTCL